MRFGFFNLRNGSGGLKEGRVGLNVFCCIQVFPKARVLLMGLFGGLAVPSECSLQLFINNFCFEICARCHIGA